MTCFTKVLETLDSIANTASTKEKMRIIAENDRWEDFKSVVWYALSPYLTYKMSGNIQAINAYETDAAWKDIDSKIFYKLSEFSNKAALTQKEKQDFSDLVRMAGPSGVEVVNRILNKDLRCGASILTFRNASENFYILPIHYPMKGIDNLSKFFAQAKRRANVCWSYKLDGTRTWAIVDENKVLWLSSNGHELNNFHSCDKPLLGAYKKLDLVLYGRKLIFDGEMVNTQGDFSRHMSQFRRLKDMDATGFRFRAFDCLYGFQDSRKFQERFLILARLLPAWRPGQDGELCAYLPHESLDEPPKKLARQAVNLGLEGIMLKTWDFEYQTKRSNSWCKVKFFHSEDLPVIGKVEGTGKYRGKLGALIVKRGDIQVEVGSGFTDAERLEFWNELPACVEVKYQDVLPSGSLRFPVFMRVRDDKA